MHAVQTSVSTAVESMDEAIPLLRRPFTPAAVRWKVQSTWPREGEKKGAFLVAYIDARLVIERLNYVAAGKWTAAYRTTSDPKLAFCDLTVLGTTRTDIGGSSKGLSKDLISDALKRAAVQFGVGVSIYALKEQSAKVGTDTGEMIEARNVGGKPSLVLTPVGHARLREGYRAWLEGSGNAWGDPIDHGDDPGGHTEPPVDEAVDEADDFTPAAPERLDTPEAAEKIVALEQAYAKLGVDRGAYVLPPAKFRALLEGSWHSMAGLEQLGDYIAGL